MAGMPSHMQETDVTDYIKKSIDKGQQSESRAEVALHPGSHQKGVELKHGEWIKQAGDKLTSKRFTSPLFALVLVFALLFAGSVYLFENLPNSHPFERNTYLYENLVSIHMTLLPD